jgi:hypothetical protein
MSAVRRVFAAFGLLVLGGLVAIALAYWSVADTLVVPRQLPAFVSGGMGGLALVLLGVGFSSIHANRVQAARERADNEAVLDEAAALRDAVLRRRS